MTRNHPRLIATLFPPSVADALIAAAQRKDHEAIDALTDELWRLGLCRRRDDQSRFESVAQFNGQGRPAP